MSAYFIANYTITDPDAYYKQYIPQVMPLVGKYEGQPLVVDAEAKGLEGAPQRQLVVIQFPSREAAEGWYNDPDYAPVAAIRHAATENGWATISDHFVMP